MAAGDVDVAFTKVRAFNSNVFDGVDDYVEIPHNAAQLGANLSNGFTISAWINPRSSGESAQGGRILDKSTGISANDGLYISHTASQINVRLNTSTKISGTQFVNGVWNHMLITISSGQLLSFYANGVLSGTANQDLVQTIATITTTNAIRIGNRATATDGTFDGSIKSVKMWNRVLSTTEIAADFAGSTPQAGLIHHFKLGGDYTDYGSVGVTATNSGSIVQTVEDQVATAIKTQRATAGATGKFIVCSGIKGQIHHAAITE